MLPLVNLLSRFKNLTNTERVKKELVGEVLKKYNISLPHTQITFSKNTIFLKVPPILKTEVALQKNNILKEITNIPGLKNIQDIH